MKHETRIFLFGLSPTLLFAVTKNQLNKPTRYNDNSLKHPIRVGLKITKINKTIIPY
jgi:hypothetical protein